MTVTPKPGSGHDYIHMLSDTVNPANGSVNLRINVPTPTGRGINVPFAIMYSSGGVWDPSSYVNARGIIPILPNGFQNFYGWSYSIPQLNSQHGTGYVNYANNPAYPCHYEADYVFTDAAGAQHNLGLGFNYQIDQPCAQLSYYYVGGDDFVHATMDDNQNVIVSEPNGTVYRFPPPEPPCVTLPSSITDRNGNVVTFSCGPGIAVHDTLGRTALSVSGLGNNGDTISVAGVFTPYTLSWQQYSAYFTDGDKVGGGTIKGISRLDLPNGTHYSFSYDPAYGLLKQVTYPGGGWVRYDWSLNPQSDVEMAIYESYENDVVFSWPAVSRRYVSYDGSTIALEQDFSYSTNWRWDPQHITADWTTKTTTVTTHDFITGQVTTTEYNYVPMDNPVLNDPFGAYAPSPPPEALANEQSIKYKDANGTTLRTVNKTWYDADLLKSEQTLENGLSSQVTYAYGTAGQLTEKDEYDFGAVSPTRQTHITYQPFSSPTPGVLAALPCRTIITDGSSTAETDNYYDGNSGLCGTVTSGTETASVNGLPENTHDEALYGPTSTTPRGNLTKQVRVLSGGNGPTTTYTYDETGQVLRMTDPCGNSDCSADMSGSDHTTKYSYGDCYVSGGTPSGNTNAYLTTITHPTVNGIALNENYCYDYSNGQLKSATDANGNTTNYTYNDPLVRLTFVSYPDGGQTSYSYNDQGPHPTITTTNLITSGVNKTTTSIMDGLGQETQTQFSDPQGTDFVDISYDAFGRVRTRSNPHRSTGSSTDGSTTFIYDALGRTGQIMKPDGSKLQWCYNGIPSTGQSNCTSGCGGSTSWVDYSDEAGAPRRSCSDGLGRVVEVDEPGQGQGSTTPATSGTGSVTIGGTLQGSGGTQSTGSVTISGSGQRQYVCPGGFQSKQPSVVRPDSCIGGYYVYNTGSVSITVGTLTKSTNYTYGNTSSGIANALVASFNGDGSSPVTAQQSGSTINFTSKSTGSSTNYSLSASCTYNSTYFGSCSFSGTRSGPTMTGGTNGSYDSGTTSITINSTEQFQYSWSGSGTTASSIAQALTTNIHNQSAYVDATLSGTTINLTARTTGTGTNYPLSASTSEQLGSFLSTASGASLTGGADQQTTAGPWSLSTPYVTYYRYNVLDNLLCAAQKGTDTGSGTSCLGAPATWRPRSFGYDSLSRLTSSYNPESGSISYVYDANGNVSSKTAPAPNQTASATVTTTYSYDPLNRILSKTYSDGGVTPSVSYSYDVPPAWGLGGLTNLKGRLVEVAEHTGATNTSTVNSYDAMGRTVAQWEQTPSVYPSGYFLYRYYDKIGDLDSYTNPAGVTISTPHNNIAARVYSVSSSLVSPPNYPATLWSADAASGYYPAGQIRKATFGNNLTEGNLYQPRLQPCRMTVNTSGTVLTSCDAPTASGNVQDFHYTFGNWGSTDNGNVTSWAGTGAQNFNRGYAYDPLNRLSSMASPGEDCNAYAWSYDAWGNRLSQSGTGTCLPTSTTAPTVLNQIAGFQYDAAGNLLNDGTYTYTYDAEDRLTTVKTGGTSVATYQYDGNGMRIRKDVPGEWTEYYYGANGVDSELTNSSWSTHYIHLDGRLIGEYKSGTTYFIHADHLGSTRLVTDINGNVNDNLDFLPFGEQTRGDTTTTHKFTGKERDSETGLDYFGARYYGSNMGRWMSPDWSSKPVPVPYAKLGNPQSLNLYSYVLNNPLRLADTDGHQDCAHPEGGSCSTKTKTDQSAMRVGDTGVLLYQKTTVTTTVKDSDGNVASQTTTTTVTYAKYDLSGETPRFVTGTQTVNPGLFSTPTAISESEALSAFGGASHVYDSLAGMIRSDGNTRFGAKVAAGALTGGEVAEAYATRSVLGAVWAGMKHYLYDKAMESSPPLGGEGIQKGGQSNLQTTTGGGDAW